jgi:2-keto-4-pentenoate hydratase/2-oxohepta-3-ene-1,7-dioic acid hydratase in catechol pathway
MKLLRYGPLGKEKPGLMDRNGNIRDLSAHVAQIDYNTLAPKELARLKLIDIETLPVVKGKPRLAVPYAGISKFIGIGLNYSDHAAEAGMAIPTEPVVFSKATTCIVGPNEPIILPKGATKLDYEVELGVVIGTKASYITEERALSVVAGYCVVNDVSERQFQIERSSQWDIGKGCDTFGPIGPFLVTSDEIRDPQKLHLWLDVNGEQRQRGNTRNMIFGVAKIVSYVSQFMTLLPGDIITTGTPPGVAMGMKPPRWLKPGDSIELGIDGLGEQHQIVKAYSGK